MIGYPKKLEGLCVGVLSGDRVLFQGPPDRENGGFKQKVLHLSAIQAPKVDAINAKDQKYGYASRQYLRTRLVGKKLSFTIEKKVNEIQIGYVMYDNEDITIGLLKEGLAKLRGQKIQADHFDDYKDAEQDAKMTEVGIWCQQNDKTAYRFLKRDVQESEIIKKYKGDIIRGVIEQVHPSKAIVYFPKEGHIGTLNFSDIQVVVLSEKNNKGETIKSNVRAIRSILESSFLNRQVNIHISNSSKDSFQGYFTLEDQDVRKVLLENGFAKLGKDAMSQMNTKQFIQLKGIAQKALEQGLGLWKDQKVVKGTTSNEKQYNAVVTEIHSGDSISIYHSGKKQIIRVFFPNVRAPSVSQEYSFQSKQALRKKCIGKKVKVETQFSKKITVKKFEGDVGELKNFLFASVFEGNINLSVYMLQQGLISLQSPRTQEDMTKYLQDLKNAETKGKKERRGLHKSQHIKIPTYNDISGGKGKKVDASKAKTLFEFLLDQPNLTGVIELVLNGSRFKVRFNQQHVMAIIVLDGIRCLPNEGEFSKSSEEALQYSKLNALQRDFEIKLKRVDQKGIYHGTIVVGKRDYALDLIENGHAVVMSRNKNPRYEEVEAEARKKRIGLWQKQLNLVSIKGGDLEKQFKPVNFIKNLNLIEVINPSQFYMEHTGCKKPQVPQKPSQAQSVVLGELYNVQFTDGVYYRGKVTKVYKNQYEVHFIDYGNYDRVPKSKIGILSEELKKTKSPIVHASLYGLQGFSKESTNILKDFYDVGLKVQMKQQSEDGEFRVILWDKNKCINQEILEFGEAENTTTIQAWIKAEETARTNRQGKWNDDY